MDFSTFMNKLHPIIGAGSSTHAFTKTVFETILTEDAQNMLDGISEVTYKAYFNGNNGISKLSKKACAFIEPYGFAEYINQFPDSTITMLCEEFSDCLPNATKYTIGEELENLLTDIIKKAATSQRKAATTKKQVNSSNANNEKQEETAKDERTDDEIIFDNLKKPLEMFAEALQKQKHQVAEQIIANNKKEDSTEDESGLLYSKFKRESFDIIRYCIDTDISAESVRITLADEIDDLIRKWQFEVRRINNREYMQIIAETMNTLSKYQVYLSEKYLHRCENCDALIFNNSSAEEGEILREELRPESIRLRKILARLFDTMWPIPEFDEPEQIEAEVVDDRMPSGAADKTNITIIQNQTNIEHDESKTFNIKDSNVTFKL